MTQRRVVVDPLAMFSERRFLLEELDEQKRQEMWDREKYPSKPLIKTVRQQPKKAKERLGSVVKKRKSQPVPEPVEVKPEAVPVPVVVPEPDLGIELCDGYSLSAFLDLHEK